MKIGILGRDGPLCVEREGYPQPPGDWEPLPGAPDAVVMAWAEAHDCALVTCDTDLGQMYWREQRSRPSIIQLGAPDWLPDQYGEAVLEALVACETDAPQCYFVRITSSAGYLLRRLPLS